MQPAYFVSNVPVPMSSATIVEAVSQRVDSGPCVPNLLLCWGGRTSYSGHHDCLESPISLNLFLLFFVG